MLQFDRFWTSLALSLALMALSGGVPALASCGDEPAPRVDWSSCDKRKLRLKGNDLADADLSKAELGGSDLREAVLAGARLDDAHLGGAVLDGADLSGADLSKAELNRASLKRAD